MVDAKLSKSEVKRINKKLIESLQNYRKIMNYMGADMPIECLCLPKATQKTLLDNGILRIYDLLNRDLTEIKGIGKVRRRDLAASLDKFFSVG